MHRARWGGVVLGMLLVGPIALNRAASGQGPSGPDPSQTAPSSVPPGPATNSKVEPGPTVLAMSPAVACLRVEGLDQYTVLPDATLTSADKLKVYFRPLHYKVETDLTKKSPYRAHLVEDCRIRRKGEKTPVAKEDKLLEYETRFDSADYRIYLVNTIGLESLRPGDYELDITIHDRVDGQATARQTMPFRIIPGAADAPAQPAAEPTRPASTKKPSTRSGRLPKRPG